MWIVVAFGMAAGCGGKGPPTGALGARWGEPVAEVAGRLGITCNPSGGSPFQTCWGGPVTAFDRPASVGLVGRGGSLAGVTVNFKGDCDYRELQKRIAAHYGVSYTEGEPSSPYTSWTSGEVVHFKECVLTVGDAEYGDYFVGNLIREGFRDLGGAMTPH